MEQTYKVSTIETIKMIGIMINAIWGVLKEEYLSWRYDIKIARFLNKMLKFTLGSKEDYSKIFNFLNRSIQAAYCYDSKMSYLKFDKNIEVKYRETKHIAKINIYNYTIDEYRRHTHREAKNCMAITKQILYCYYHKKGRNCLFDYDILVNELCKDLRKLCRISE